MKRYRNLLPALLLVFTLPATAAEALVAVATNFVEVMEELVDAFNQRGQGKISFTSGATGALYAQIRNGAPFDILMAADQARPRLLVETGVAEVDSQFTYATGRLALWSPDADLLHNADPSILATSVIRRIAIANPEIAPYGAAARETMSALHLKDALSEKIVMGSNIGQTHALVATGNADVGFVALSYVLSPRNLQPGSRWDVPADLHNPIHQDAVLLKRGAGNQVATGFLDFVRSEAARGIIRGFGYGVVE